MNTTQLVLTVTVGIDWVIAMLASLITATRGSTQPSKDHPGLYKMPPRWATAGGPVIAGIATTLTAAASIAGFLIM